MDVQAAVAESASMLGKELKDKQLEAITSFVEGNDIFVSLPTGYGKSLIYGILPLVFDKLRGENRLIYSCYEVSSSKSFNVPLLLYSQAVLAALCCASAL